VCARHNVAIPILCNCSAKFGYQGWSCKPWGLTHVSAHTELTQFLRSILYGKRPYLLVLNTPGKFQLQINLLTSNYSISCHRHYYVGTKPHDYTSTTHPICTLHRFCPYHGLSSVRHQTFDHCWTEDPTCDTGASTQQFGTRTANGNG
jgi:hypothetical protein